MNKKGYTLVELIGVIVLLAIIMTLVSTSIIHIIKTANTVLDETTKEILYNQADLYLNENISLKPNGKYIVSISTLIEQDKLSSNFLNNYSSDELTLSSCVIVTYSNSIPTYEFMLDCSSIVNDGD